MNQSPSGVTQVSTSNMFSPLIFWRSYVAILGPVVLASIPLYLLADEENMEAIWCLYTILVCALYWIAECVPIPITSCLPLVLLPLLGVASTQEVAPNYLNSTNMMFVAGLMMAIAVEHCGLHHRIAFNIIRKFTNENKLTFIGFHIYFTEAKPHPSTLIRQ